MTIPRRRFLQLSGASAMLVAAPHVARAQGGYPNRPVKLIVGQAAGSASDIIARLFAQWWTERLGQQFIVETRPGAGGNIATEFVTRAPPDGYTIMLVNSQNTINVALHEKLPFDLVRDIAPIALVERVPLIMEVHPSVPANTVPEFIAYARPTPARSIWGPRALAAHSTCRVSCSNTWRAWIHARALSRHHAGDHRSGRGADTGHVRRFDHGVATDQAGKLRRSA